MKKIAISLLLLSSINANAGTMVAPGVELLSRETWTTGGATGHVEHFDGFFSVVVPAAHVNSVRGRVYQNILLKGTHGIYMQNTENVTRNYTVEFSLCANKIYCVRNVEHYRLAAHGDYRTQAKTTLYASFTSAGVYPLYALTNISGDASTNYISNGTVTVTN